MSGPLVVLPELGRCSSPITLTTRHGNTKRYPKGFLVYERDTLLYLHSEVAFQFLLSSQDQLPQLVQ